MSAPPPFGYYDAPLTQSSGSLGIVALVRVYAGVMAIGYAVLGFSWVSMGESGPALYVFAALFAALAAGHAVATLMPRKPWAWTYGLVVLAVGLASCGIVFAIPLLVYWVRPPCKAAFMRM